MTQQQKNGDTPSVSAFSGEGNSFTANKMINIGVQNLKKVNKTLPPSSQQSVVLPKISSDQVSDSQWSTQQRGGQQFDGSRNPIVRFSPSPSDGLKQSSITGQNISKVEKKEIKPKETNFKKLFSMKEVIGKGSFGKVYKVFQQTEKQLYAMKEISVKGFSKEMMDKILKEIQIMAQLRNYYVIHYTTSWIENNSILYIVMELCYNTLREVLKQKQLEFNRQQFETMTSIEYYISSELFKEILKGINYLHKLNPPIIHRDLKPTNILITFGTNGRFVKIADFGLATDHKFNEESHTEGLGTVKYIAQEVQRGRSYDMKSDIYSLGVITQELFGIDIYASTNNPIENSLLKDRYKTIDEYILQMMSPKGINRPDCETLLKNKSLWYLDLNAIESDLIQQNFNELPISELSIEKCFAKFFIKTKLMNK